MTMPNETAAPDGAQDGGVHSKEGNATGQTYHGPDTPNNPETMRLSGDFVERLVTTSRRLQTDFNELARVFALDFDEMPLQKALYEALTALELRIACTIPKDARAAAVQLDVLDEFMDVGRGWADDRDKVLAANIKQFLVEQGGRP